MLMVDISALFEKAGGIEILEEFNDPKYGDISLVVDNILDIHFNQISGCIEDDGSSVDFIKF